jgi:hypothetical protein
MLMLNYFVLAEEIRQVADQPHIFSFFFKGVGVLPLFSSSSNTIWGQSVY